MVSKIDKSSPASAFTMLTGRSSKVSLPESKSMGSSALPQQWRVELMAMPAEQRLTWLASSLTRQVLAERFALFDENSPEYIRLSRRIRQMLLSTPQEVKRLNQLLSDTPT